MTAESTVATRAPAKAAGQPGPTDQERNRLFLRLFLQNQRRLFAYILTLLPNRADADDVLQDASLAMWDKFDAQQPPNDFLAWARRFAYHKVLDFYKKSQRSQSRLSQIFMERISAAAGESTDGDARRDALAGCLEKLAPRDRELLNHRYAEGATTQSTSIRVGRSVDAVYKSLSKLRQGLFECVQKTLAEENRS